VEELLTSLTSQSWGFDPICEAGVKSEYPPTLGELNLRQCDDYAEPSGNMAKAILIAEENEANAITVLDALSTAHAKNSSPTAGTEDSAVMSRWELATHTSRERLAMPEVLLLNLKTPRAGGFEVMDWVRAQSHLKNTWVVVVSGNDGSMEVQLGYGLGALLIKPCSDHDIQKMMQWFADSGEGGTEGPLRLT
jgi:CheY-like chemotaxis protein